MILGVLMTVLELFALMGVGIYFAGKCWFKDGMNFMSKYLVYIAFPCNVFCSVISYLTGGMQQAILIIKNTGWVTAVMLISALLAFLVAVLFRVKRNRKSVFIGAVGFPNVLLIGFPVVQGILGESALGEAIAFFVADIIVFWTLGIYLLIIFGDQKDESSQKIFSKDILKQAISPSLVALVLGAVVMLAEIPVPDIVLDVATKFSQSNMAISMIFIGGLIRAADFSLLKDYRTDIGIVLVTKFIVLPVVTILALMFMPMSSTAKMVTFLINMMPMSVSLSVLAHEYHCDSEFAAVVGSLMNIIFIGLTPIYVIIIEILNVF